MGELASLAAAALWAGASLLFTAAGRSLGADALNLAKCTLGLVLLALTLALTTGLGWPEPLGAVEVGWLAASGVVGLAVGDTAYFGALVRIGPRRALLLWALAPPLTALAAVPVLGEPFGPAMAAGIALTLGGVVWVVRERVATDATVERARLRAGVALGVLAAVGQAFANVTIKLGGGAIDALQISVVRLVFGVVALTALLAVRGRLGVGLAPLATPSVARRVVAGTLLGTYLGIWLSMAGLRYAYAGVAATLQATSPLFVLPLAAWLLGERISARAVLGAVLAVGGVALLFLVPA